MAPKQRQRRPRGGGYSSEQVTGIQVGANLCNGCASLSDPTGGRQANRSARQTGQGATSIQGSGTSRQSQDTPKQLHTTRVVEEAKEVGLKVSEHSALQLRQLGLKPLYLCLGFLDGILEPRDLSRLFLLVAL